MPRTSRELLRSVYRLLGGPQTEGTKKVWEALREEIEQHLVDTWEPVEFVTAKSSINETCSDGRNESAEKQILADPSF